MQAIAETVTDGGLVAWESNPLVAHVRRLGLRTIGPEPTLFESGTIPPYLASGLDPMTLTHIPAAARHSLARARTMAAVRHLLATYAEDDAAERAARDFAGDEGNVRYADRVRLWVGALPGELPLGVHAWLGVA